MAESTIIVNNKAQRTASIEYLRVKVAYADFKTKEFGEAEAFYFDDIDAKDEKILADLQKQTGMVFQAVVEKEVLSGLYVIKNSEYVANATRVGDARESKASEAKAAKK